MEVLLWGEGVVVEGRKEMGNDNGVEGFRVNVRFFNVFVVRWHCSCFTLT